MVGGENSISECCEEARNCFAIPVEKSDNSNFSGLKNIFEKSLAVNKDLKAGHVLRFEDLEAKKPKGFGMEASRFEEVIGRKLSRDLKQWEFLKEESFSKPHPE